MHFLRYHSRVGFFLLFSFLPLFGGWEYYHNGYLKSLAPISSTTRSSVVFLKDSFGQKVGVTNRIIYKPKNSTCQKQLHSQFGSNYRFINGDVLLYVKNPKEVFDVSREIYESGCALFAHPDFLVFAKKRSFDPFFDQQWNYYNYGQDGSLPDIDLNVYEAWQYATGKGVKVALIDNGFDFAHPDLKNAFVDQIDLVNFDANASYDNGYEIHGTACAGLIGARKNGEGIQGAAYDSKLIGIKLIGAYPDGSDKALFVSSIVQAFLYADEVGSDVINCSWGTYNVADAVRDAIDYLAYNGREGKGIPIVFASGNDGRSQSYWAEDESALPSVFAVGAVNNLGGLAWYSNYGPALDFVAPSGGGTLAIATDDIVGAFGYADGSLGHPDYCYATDMTGFNGTSAAAPQVSGVIALMLERNPDLTRDQIYDILAQTAKKIGEETYIYGRNDFYGYGLIDAESAVKEAIRLKVESEIKDKSYDIDGYFLHIGPEKFDWVYVSGDIVAKLAGMDTNGHLIWDPVLDHAFSSIQIENDQVFFGESINSTYFAQFLAKKRFDINGYFVHYNIGSYDWIYISTTGKSYKLEGLSYDNNFLWVPLQIEAIKEGDKILF